MSASSGLNVTAVAVVEEQVLGKFLVQTQAEAEAGVVLWHGPVSLLTLCRPIWM